MSESSSEQIHELWRSLCLQMPCAVEDHPFGEGSTVFKINGRDRSKGKIFALILEHAGRVMLNLKCEPAIADQQRKEYPQIIPGYHMNKKHWNSVLPGLGNQTMLELIEDSYDLVVDGFSRSDREFIQNQAQVARESLD